jgi:hypothetical protein
VLERDELVGGGERQYAARQPSPAVAPGQVAGKQEVAAELEDPYATTPTPVHTRR